LQQNQSSPVDVTIKIYTVAGRLIATLQENGLVGNFLTIGWDGRDQDGNEIANGVYLYKVIIRTSDGGLSTEVLGKLAKVQ
jgi:flagellar hook assembly protein FlgD